MKKIWFLPMLASSTMLTGCASLLQDSATYDPEVSRAGNIGKIFEIEIDDQEVAQGIELGNDSSVMLDSLVWSGSLQTAGRVGGLPREALQKPSLILRPENFCLLHKLNFCANDCSGYF